MFGPGAQLQDGPLAPQDLAGQAPSAPSLPAPRVALAKAIQRPYVSAGPPQPPAAAVPPAVGLMSVRTAPQAVVASSRPPVDTTQRYLGTVRSFYKWQGYGFIDLEEKGVVPGDAVFVYWKSISSADRYPTLARGMQVELTLAESSGASAKQLAAADVTLPGGGVISLQDDADRKKTFVGGQFLRYTGNLKFFIPTRGYGYIVIDPGYDFFGEQVPHEIRAETAEMNAGGHNPKYMKDVQVEFSIWKTPKGAFKAYNVTLPGGQALPEGP